MNTLEDGIIKQDLVPSNADLPEFLFSSASITSSAERKEKKEMTHRAQAIGIASSVKVKCQIALCLEAVIRD